MSKNPRKKCHRNSNVSMTRLSNNSTNKKQMYHYSHESGRAVQKWFPSSEHCPQFPLGTCHLSTLNRENGSDGKTYPFFSYCHYHCTVLPTQSLGFFSIPYPTLLHWAFFLFWQEGNYLFAYYILFIMIYKKYTEIVLCSVDILYFTCSIVNNIGLFYF